MAAEPDANLKRCRRLIAIAQYAEAAAALDRLAENSEGQRLLTVLELQVHVLRAQGLFEKAISRQRSLHEMVVQCGDQRTQAKVLTNLGHLYLMLSRFEEALEALTKAYHAITTKDIDLQIVLYSALSNLEKIT